MADERSVDMAEATDPPPAGERSRPAAAVSRLTPTQEAWAEFVQHARCCARCRDVDSDGCDAAERLWRAWQTVSGAAMQQVRQA